MAVTYTTAALVKKRVKYISSSLLDADIEENILQVESFIDSIMRATARGTSPDFSFNSARHGLIRVCATDHAAYLCIIYDPSEFPSLDDVEVVASLLWNSVAMALSLLADPRIVDQLKSYA
jgi:hypothetical protein